MVTHLEGCPGQERARSNSSNAPFVFFNFLTRVSTAFSAHRSSSSPCFQPSSRFTAGDVKLKRELSPALIWEEMPPGGGDGAPMDIGVTW